MGGRGSSYVTKSERIERAREFMDDMRKMGIEPKKSLEESAEILKDTKMFNDIRKRQNRYMDTAKMANYQTQYYKTSNPDNQKGYMAEKKALTTKLAYHPDQYTSIVNKALTKHNAKVNELETKMKNATSEAEWRRAKKQQDVAIGKWTAAHFLSASKR